ncbi:MAG: replicative DNA helicase [Myxococcota bacterium]
MTRTLPNNIEAEKSVLGGILLRGDALRGMQAEIALEPDDFYRPAHQDIFSAMLTLADRSEPIDPVTLEAELKRRETLVRAGGLVYLGELQASVPTAENIVHYARLVRDASTARILVQRASEIVARGYEGAGDVDQFVDQSEQSIFEVAQRTQQTRFQHIKPIIKATFDAIADRAGRDEDLTGVPTGFADLDRLTWGLQASELILLAARPSVGKTSFALSIATNAAVKFRIPVLFFSIEMAQRNIAERLLCAEASVDTSRVRGGKHLSPRDWTALTQAASRLGETPFFIDDSSAPSAMEIRAKARRFRSDRQLFKDENAKGLIVIDYLQLVSPAAGIDNREQQVAHVSRSLKALAKEVRMPVLALSQLRRSAEDRDTQEPRLSDLRESGALEQDADVVAFLYRPNKDDKAQVKLAIAKQRNGPIGQVDLVFLETFTRFESGSRRDHDEM